MQISLKDAVITVSDGGSGEVTVTIGDGDLSVTETRNLEYLLDRGVLSSVREGDDVPVEVSFDCRWEKIAGDGSGGADDIYKILKGIDPYTTSTDTDTCAPYACDIVVAYDPTCGVGSGTMTLPDFRMEKCDFSFKNGTLSFSGKCNVTAPTLVADNTTTA